MSATSPVPPPLVPVFTGVPGRPIAWLDPRPHVADENGHVWRLPEDEPTEGAKCMGCSMPRDAAGVRDQRCSDMDAELLAWINKERAAYIARHRVDGVFPTNTVEVDR